MFVQPLCVLVVPFAGVVPIMAFAIQFPHAGVCCIFAHAACHGVCHGLVDGQ
jgi:hypothetical protein